MNSKSFRRLITAIIITELAGAFGAFFTSPKALIWYATLAKPPLTPPSWLFGPVWGGLYFLMGLALFLVWQKDFRVVRPLIRKGRRAWNPYSQRFWMGDWQTANIIAIFALQYVLNVAWSWVFFGLEQPGAAFFVILALWCSIVYLIINSYRVSRAAAWLLAPYLAWVTFAAYLNGAIWLGN